jgi:hypothetical protein
VRPEETVRLDVRTASETQGQEAAYNWEEGGGARLGAVFQTRGRGLKRERIRVRPRESVRSEGGEKKGYDLFRARPEGGLQERDNRW